MDHKEVNTHVCAAQPSPHSVHGDSLEDATWSPELAASSSLQQKEQGLPGEMAKPDEPGTPAEPDARHAHKTKDGKYQRDTSANLRGLLITRARII